VILSVIISARPWSCLWLYRNGR